MFQSAVEMREDSISLNVQMKDSSE